MIEELVERCFNGAAREQNVVGQNDGRAIHVHRDLSGSEFLGNRMFSNIVAVKGNIEGTDVAAREERRKTLGEKDPTVCNPQKQHALARPKSRRNALSYTVDCGVNFVFVDSASVGHEDALWPVWAGMGRSFPPEMRLPCTKKATAKAVAFL